MKSIKGLLFILLILICFFCVGQAAFALIGSQAGDAGGITVYPKAHGTRYEGPLTIYYTNPQGIYADMNFFLRLRIKTTLYAFSGQALGVKYLDITEQQAKITDFIEKTVMPVLYPPTDYEVTPDFLLKSVDLKVEDDGLPALESPCCNGMLFTIMDVVIAVQD